MPHLVLLVLEFHLAVYRYKWNQMWKGSDFRGVNLRRFWEGNIKGCAFQFDYNVVCQHENSSSSCWLLTLRPSLYRWNVKPARYMTPEKNSKKCVWLRKNLVSIVKGGRASVVFPPSPVEKTETVYNNGIWLNRWTLLVQSNCASYNVLAQWNQLNQTNV